MPRRDRGSHGGSCHYVNVFKIINFHLFVSQLQREALPENERYPVTQGDGPRGGGGGGVALARVRSERKQESVGCSELISPVINAGSV